MFEMPCEHIRRWLLYRCGHGWPFHGKYLRQKLMHADLTGRPVRSACISFCLYLRCSIDTNCKLVGPTYSDSGRIKRLLPTCSRICAVQPTTLLAAEVGVNISPGKPTEASNTAE